MLLSTKARGTLSTTVVLMGGLTLGCTHSSAVVLPTAPATHVKPAAQSPAALTFAPAKNSDEWVERTFQIQTRYTRVLLVDAGESPAKNIRVRALHLNARAQPSIPPSAPPPGAFTDLTVDRVFKTLQEAADAAEGVIS
ncbi:MAG: hypothetical protein IPK82_30960 [Polyangiaceae bacterium]|nr:hypothetical protein [Polyangiaceae bacterium]